MWLGVSRKIFEFRNLLPLTVEFTNKNFDFTNYFVLSLRNFQVSFIFFQEEDEDDECVLKGKSTSLSAFFRVARNMMSMIFKEKLTGNNLKHF